MKLEPLYYLSGPDGAGKTTALRLAVEQLTARGAKVKTLYGLNRFLRYVGKRADWAASKARGHATEVSFREFVARGGGHRDRDPGSRAWRLKKGALLLAGLVDIQLGYALALAYRAAGYTVLVETSPFDLFVKYHMPHFTVLEPLGARTVPSPTLYFLLEGSSEAIHARKPELEEDEIRYYYARLNAVLRHLPQATVVRLRADQGLEQLQADLTRCLSTQ